jgi:hypothetical protein
MTWAIFPRPYDDKVHNRRKMIFQSYNKEMFAVYQQHMQKEAMDLVRRIMKTPDNFYMLINRFA